MVRADGREAFMQWCWKVIQTEREAFLAYSDDIGTEFEDMEDFPDKDSRESEIERTITDALLVHPQQSTSAILFLITALEMRWFRS